MGDAWIQKYKNRSCSYSFRFEQSIEAFTDWKAKMIGLPFSKSSRNRFDKRTGKTYHAYCIGVKMPKFDKERYHQMFYNEHKEVSQFVVSKLDPLAICVWYLDDGNVYYNGNNCHITLAVNGFNEDSRERIIKYFKDTYNLNFKHSSKAIRITSRRECEIFMSIVEQYIPECMQYKKLSIAIDRYDKTLTDEQRRCRNNKYRER